jgi:hypothetical protein
MAFAGDSQFDRLQIDETAPKCDIGLTVDQIFGHL